MVPFVCRIPIVLASFGQGTKEDTPVPSPTSGSIPGNKSDLTRFYVAHDVGTDADIEACGFSSALRLPS